MGSLIEDVQKASAGVTLLIGWCVATTALLAFQVANSSVPTAGLDLKSLDFERGLFVQSVHSDTVGVTVRGRWAAEITETGGRHICSGGGIAPYDYDQAPVLMTPNEWTGGDCSTLKVGSTYVARAVWEWAGGQMTYGFEFIFEKAGDP